MASISQVITYIPSIGDNHSKNDEERFSVKLKAVSVSKKQGELRKFVDADPKKLTKELMSDNRTSEIRKLLEEHFVRFVNFDLKSEATAEDVEKGVPVKYDEPDGDKVMEVGQEYSARSMTLSDLFELGEYELLMEIFMYLVGSSQLKKVERPLNAAKSTAGDDQGDEEKNSESPSGTTLTH